MFPATSKSRRPPLDCAALDRLALAYVARFATTRAKLAQYLKRKVEQRGWADEGAPPVAAIADRMAALGYVDDQLFARARANALTRKGYGRRRVAAALAGAGIDADDAAAAIRGRGPDHIQEEDEGDAAMTVALAFARRRRIGPFATTPPDDAARRRAFAALMRAGHDPDVARRVMALAPGEADPD
ncbi:regulatory protein [Sphingomonas zeicaulis]|uniref:RecX family transcriptional regulator n=1 Tax=Sphingomonas zeicaulis TaxID=1632740 RepID=UPI003D251389